MRTEDKSDSLDFTSALAQLFSTRPETVVARTAELFELRDPNFSLDLLRKVISDGDMPVLVANHQSLVDGPALSIITSQLNLVFNLPVAASLDEGLQGASIQAMNSQIYPVLELRNLHMVPIVTERDVTTRNMVRKSTGLPELLRTAREKRGFAMFPEATVQGGRTNGEGMRNGLVRPPNPNAFSHWMNRFANHGASPVIFPVAIDRSFNVFDPDSNTFPQDALRMLVNYEQPRKIAAITLGDPIPFGKIEAGLQTDDFFMERIANLLPQHARGVYSR